ncbi:MAG: GAF and ANTAR domain-containing protein [Candidatus Omnitrophica bacterium]|nr:GAF and ANTAR domain-containing protein [Candidatus Omnitrophota bacterium]
MTNKKTTKKTTKKSSSYKKQIETLSKISEAVTSTLYLEDILKLIVTVTAEVMDSKICSLMLLDEKGQKLSVKATQSIIDAYNKKPSLRLGEGVAGKVVLTGKHMIVKDVRKDTNYINIDIAKKASLCSLLCVPLQVKGKAIGVLNLYTAKPHKFTKSEIDVLSTVANQAAIVIENAQLLVKTKVVQEELEARKLIERAKGILMKTQGHSEDEAFKKIQRLAMNTRRSMREIAEAIILAQSVG